MSNFLKTICWYPVSSFIEYEKTHPVYMSTHMSTNNVVTLKLPRISISSCMFNQSFALQIQTV